MDKAKLDMMDRLTRQNAFQSRFNHLFKVFWVDPGCPEMGILREEFRGITIDGFTAREFVVVLPGQVWKQPQAADAGTGVVQNIGQMDLGGRVPLAAGLGI